MRSPLRVACTALSVMVVAVTMLFSAGSADAAVSKQAWGPWFKSQLGHHCRNYASVTSGHKIRFRSYTECKQKSQIITTAIGSMNGTASVQTNHLCYRTRATTWCDTVVYKNNKKGKQTWCATSVSTIDGYWPNVVKTRARACIR